MTGSIKLHNIKFAFLAVFEISNWKDYFKDLFNMTDKPEVIFTFRNGLKYSCRPNSTDRGIITSTALGDEYKINGLKLKNATVIDLGGQLGAFSVTISKNSKNIYVYEPMPENYKLLKKNISLNNLKKKIHPFNLAISNKKKVKLFISKDNTGGHSVYGKGRYVDADTITLKEIFDRNKIKKCDVLKVDIEGSEYDALYSLPNEYYKRIKYLCMEYHDLDNKRKNGKYLVKFLEKRNFSVKYDEAILLATNLSYNP